MSTSRKFSSKPTASFFCKNLFVINPVPSNRPLIPDGYNGVVRNGSVWTQGTEEGKVEDKMRDAGWILSIVVIIINLGVMGTILSTLA